MQKCSRANLAKSIKEVRKLKPKKKFRPLFRHLIKLAVDSSKRGYCQRSGQELRYAKKVAKY